MGKQGKAAKRRRIEQAAAAAIAAPLSDGEDEPGQQDFLQGLIKPAEVAVTVRTLQTLTRHTELLSNKQDLKALRGAVFDFQRVGAELTGTGNSLTSRISAAISQQRHTDALVLLAEMRIRKQSPKLGALQRWVRDCDAASRSDGSFGDVDTLRVLDAILRCTHGEPEEGEEEGLIKPKKGEVVVRQKPWVFREEKGEDYWSEIKAGRFPPPDDIPALSSVFRLLHRTEAADRLPPNHHPALLFTSAPGSIPLAPPSTALKVTRHEVPHIPGGFLLADVLSKEECKRILAHTEALGYQPDQPIAEDGLSVLAHNVYWLADSSFLSTFTSRFLHLVPQFVDGGKVTGINARFRVYRYVPGAIYRPHEDGAWPASGIDPVTGEYLYDSSPKDKPQWSRLTFLIYLNDNFLNGCTTFFFPSSSPSTLNAFPVKPSAGCAMVFPHGDNTSALHEGSPVEGEGAKYVIRTEVLYEVRTREGREREGLVAAVGKGVGGVEGEKDEGVEA
ncbi:hypothetical protein JCM8547_000666 [Rhodosporidiobolus lusitaniae]